MKVASFTGLVPTLCVGTQCLAALRRVIVTQSVEAVCTHAERGNKKGKLKSCDSSYTKGGE